MLNILQLGKITNNRRNDSKPLNRRKIHLLVKKLSREWNTETILHSRGNEMKNASLEHCSAKSSKYSIPVYETTRTTNPHERQEQQSKIPSLSTQAEFRENSRPSPENQIPLTTRSIWTGQIPWILETGETGLSLIGARAILCGSGRQRFVSIPQDQHRFPLSPSLSLCLHGGFAFCFHL